MGSKYQDSPIFGCTGGTGILSKGSWHELGVPLGVEIGSLATFFSTSIKKQNLIYLFILELVLTSKGGQVNWRPFSGFLGSDYSGKKASIALWRLCLHTGGLARQPHCT